MEPVLIGFGLLVIALLVTLVVYIALMHSQMKKLDRHIQVLGPKLDATQKQLAAAFAPVDQLANAIIHPQPHPHPHPPALQESQSPLMQQHQRLQIHQRLTSRQSVAPPPPSTVQPVDHST